MFAALGSLGPAHRHAWRLSRQSPKGRGRHRRLISLPDLALGIRPVVKRGCAKTVLDGRRGFCETKERRDACKAELPHRLNRLVPAVNSRDVP